MVNSITVETSNEDSAQTNWYVYLIETQCGKLYTGSTTDPKRRFRQHSGEITGGSKFLKAQKPRKFKAIFQLPDKSAALKLEYKIKRLSRQKKDKLIASRYLDGAPLQCALSLAANIDSA